MLPLWAVAFAMANARDDFEALSPRLLDDSNAERGIETHLISQTKFTRRPAAAVSVRRAGSNRGPVSPRWAGLGGRRFAVLIAAHDPGLVTWRTVLGQGRLAIGPTVPAARRMSWWTVSGRQRNHVGPSGRGRKSHHQPTHCRPRPHRPPSVGSLYRVVSRAAGVEQHGLPQPGGRLVDGLFQGSLPAVVVTVVLLGQ